MTSTLARPAAGGAMALADLHRAAVEDGRGGVWVVELDGMTLLANGAMEDLLGLPPGGLVGRSAYDFQPETEREALTAALGRRALGISEVAEARFVRADGTEVWTMRNASPLVQGDVVVGGIALVTDFTQQRADQQQLRVQAALLHRRADEGEVLAHLSSLAVATSCYRELCHEAVMSVRQALGASHAVVGEIEGSSYVQVAAAGSTTLVPGQELDLSGFPQDLGALLAGGPVVVEDIAQVDVDLGPAGGSIAAMPFRLPTGLALVAVHHDQPRAMTTADVAFLRAVANLLAAAAARIVEYEKTRHDALHDPLTGLPNLTLLLDRAAQAVARAERLGQSLALLVVDVDHFKLVKDAEGQAQGDRLLGLLAERLASRMRGVDTLARLGGDLFAVLCAELPGGPEQATFVARRLADAAATPFELDGRRYYLTLSIGLVVAEHSVQVTDLVRDATAAMYRAKEKGGDRVHLFAPEVLSDAVFKLAIANDLREAGARDELVLHYQPQVDLVSGRITDVEALIRWHHPTLGWLAPDQFLGIAQVTGQLPHLGRWVMAQALGDLSRWSSLPSMAGVGVAINLSADELASARLLADVEDLLASTGVDPTKVTFEITESAAMADPELAARTLTALRAMGARIAVDDFGTGYSSMVYLRRLPLDILKIDRQFTDGVASEEEDRSIVQATIGLASSLNLACVAEGVETLDQAMALRSFGCQTAQGWLFSPGLPFDELEVHCSEEPADAPRVA